MSVPTPPPPPEPPRPEPETRSRPWVRRLLIGFLIVANLAIFGGLAAVWLAARQVSDQFDTVPEEIDEFLDDTAGVGDPRTFLLIGSDSRADVPDDFTNVGDFAGQRADVIILLKVIPGEERVMMLSLPRDLKIEFNGTTMRINATYGEGPADILSAVSDFAQVPIHHYLEVDFVGFAGIVDAIGGIEMTFPYPARDRKSGFEVEAGKQTLNGRQALALARSRSYQEFRDGSWVYVDTNDINRTSRQQDLLMAMFTQLDMPTSIGGFNDLVSSFSGYVSTDSNFDTDNIIELAWNMRNIGPDDMDTMTLPVVIAEEGGVSYVVPVEPDATQALAALRDGEPFEETVIGIPVVVVQNGNGTPGSAGDVATLLEGSGFEVTSVGNSGREDYSVTQVVARPSRLSKAQAVVAALGYGEAVTGATPSDVDVIVIVGSDAL